MDYEYIIGAQFRNKAEEVIDQIQFIQAGWDITLSGGGFVARKSFAEEQDARKLTQEVREIVSQYLRALGFEIGVDIQLAPSSELQIRKPGHITLIAQERVDVPDAMVVSGPDTLPKVESLNQLADIYSTDPLVRDAIDLYLEACRTERDSDIAIPLYKAWEVVKSTFDEEKEMAQVLEIPDWKNLKQNLNWHRHWRKRFPRPKKELSIVECKERVKQVIRSFIENRSK